MLLSAVAKVSVSVAKSSVLNILNKGDHVSKQGR